MPGVTSRRTMPSAMPLSRGDATADRMSRRLPESSINCAPVGGVGAGGAQPAQMAVHMAAEVHAPRLPARYSSFVYDCAEVVEVRFLRIVVSSMSIPFGTACFGRAISHAPSPAGVAPRVDGSPRAVERLNGTAAL